MIIPLIANSINLLVAVAEFPTIKFISPRQL